MTTEPVLVVQEDGNAVLDKPVPCPEPVFNEDLRDPTPVRHCTGDAFGPPARPRCADHGGPDLRACARCGRTIADDAESFDCQRYSGPIHVACHPADCRSIDCAEALTDPEPYDYDD